MHSLPPLLRDGAFRVGEALELGLPERRLRPGALPTPHHGVRAPRESASLVDRCRDVLPVLGTGQCFSHDTAAGLWGLPLPQGHKFDPLHVTSPTGGRPRRPGVVGHRAGTVKGAFVGALPIVEPVTAWAQCAALVPLDDVIAMGDALAGRWSKHDHARELPIERLAATVRAWGSRRGARRLQEAMCWIRPNVWSPKETALRLLLVRAGLPEPECNGEVTTAEGDLHADLVWRHARLAVEYEGDHHRTDKGQWRRDIARAELFADAGWRRVRATDDDLADPSRILRRISRHLTSGALQ